MSTSSTRLPAKLSAADALTAVVVFPTPPFWLAILMMRPIANGTSETAVPGT